VTVTASTSDGSAQERAGGRLRRARAPIALGAATFAAVAYVGLVDPNQAGHYPLCPTKALTGLDCPGCGGLRAVHSLAHGDVVGALDHNAFVVLVLLPAAVALWVAWLLRTLRGTDAGGPSAVSRALTRPSVVWTLIAVMAVFTVVRNIHGVPAFAWLGSGTSA
jgi:hypothetical protein